MNFNGKPTVSYKLSTSGRNTMQKEVTQDIIWPFSAFSWQSLMMCVYSRLWRCVTFNQWLFCWTQMKTHAPYLRYEHHRFQIPFTLKMFSWELAQAELCKQAQCRLRLIRSIFHWVLMKPTRNDALCKITQNTPRKHKGMSQLNLPQCYI